MTQDRTETDAPAILRGKWDRHGDEFVGSFRLGPVTRAAGVESLVGRQAQLFSRGRTWTTVTIVALVEDYGAEDVTLYTVTR